MSRIIRALLISAVATGAAALLVSSLSQSPRRQDARSATKSLSTDFDSMSEEEKQQLAGELDAML